MPSLSPSLSPCLVVLATGGTIAGRADDARDHVGYRAAQLGVDELLRSVPGAVACALEAEDVARLDSKDMDAPTWQRLAQRVDHHLRRSEVQGVVVTHGTDTLEETAWLLQRVLAPRKPVVLTAAMRPASSLQADGPQNLADALLVAGLGPAPAAGAGARGVLVVLAGRVLGATDVRKRHSFRLDAFDGGDAGPIAAIEQGMLRRWRDWPSGEALGLQRLAADPHTWPWVEIVSSHAGARAAAVDALVAAGVRGLVVAGTGNASVHRTLVPALQRAAAAGVAVRLVTRCAAGPVIAGPEHPWPIYASLSAPQARVELMLELLPDTAPGRHG